MLELQYQGYNQRQKIANCNYKNYLTHNGYPENVYAYECIWFKNDGGLTT